mmetsp:Transcript_24926/g.44327  ORF Transcript_24926/g.44327 Transcript_24926/m.44327 type:complete len:775 (+) Transcript_24926:94-2418(+)|eukprot:CAMPEP_0205903956 /NCGR_PEP_ID=MMETSP1325-20131115/417_1 /ASSEMBLY_ACC=CAM_ASM_000708 /TAXON_ID=236786 /ORGANISM="Florenciella sp., Strain RCC1007" /LENGTH=774 /DNA_ID=CAMNT_0053269665 /DNA_START=16 /DNA_END=2340 /DNA_ORIENTATION=+
MKLDVTLAAPTDGHQEMCTALTWVTSNELFTCSDDKQLLRWTQEGELGGKVAETEGFITSISWFPDVGKRAANMFACACTDGTWRIWTLQGQNAREEKKISAHTGAVISVKWNWDGSALISAGEDGELKVWSRSGNLRSSLTSAGTAVYCFVWGPDNDTVLYTAGKTLNMKSHQGTGRKALSWNAHDGIIMCCDWNRINDLIVSGGEDCIYKVWDAYGRQLFQSQPNVYVITSISWCPNGECFAVGAYNSLRLCDKTGWSYSREQPQSGSIMEIAWTSDGTQLAGAGGNGSVVFAQLVQRRLEWENFEVTLIEPKLINVQDASIDQYERLEFPRERVVEMALGWGHLVVATATQCFIYAVTNWNTPHIFDLRATPSLISLADGYFLTMDPTHGVIIYTYEGRQVSNPRFNNLQPEFLNRHTVALSKDVVAILDRTDSKTVRCFDVATGKALSTNVTHKAEIVQIALNQSDVPLSERRLALIDRNRDLYLTPVVPQPGIFRGVYKLQTQVDSMAWNDSSDMLAAIADGRLICWYYPNVVFVDRDLLPSTTIEKDGSEFGKVPQVSTFYGSRLTVRKADGALVTTSVSCYASMLYRYIGESRWEESVRLCRFVKDDKLWGCLAVMAIQNRKLETAEIALAALTEVDKLEFILHIKNIPSEEGRNAELALYRRCPDEAESILLQARPPLTYRAIKMNIRLFRWGRALELAVKSRSHVDTVLGYRQKYLDQFGKKETDKRFLQYAESVEIDWEAIQAKKQQEKDDERARAGGLSSSGK